MGGHGGLNILPHKSWNVYGAKQRQRVERDERIARDRAEAERRELDDAARDERWRELGASATDRDDASGHVNLFAREQAAATKAEKEFARVRAEAEASGTAFAGGARRDAREPWYARSREREGDGDAEERRSLPSRARRDREEDEALRRLTRRLGSRAEDDARERKREKKRAGGERRDEKRRESSRDEMERLRRERLERESKETERERELLAKRARR